MAHFYGTVKGNRSEVSHFHGSKNSGMSGQVSGWKAGVRVEARCKDGKDVFYVYATGGLRANQSEKHFATIKDGEVVIHCNRCDVYRIKLD